DVPMHEPWRQAAVDERSQSWWAWRWGALIRGGQLRDCHSGHGLDCTGGNLHFAEQARATVIGGAEHEEAHGRSALRDVGGRGPDALEQPTRSMDLAQRSRGPITLQIGPAVLDRLVVPDDQITGLPSVCDLELGPVQMREQGVEQLLALVRR